jgi:para-aminobenzoate synthetase / 4-amino-4-deoxychorismate lyase
MVSPVAEAAKSPNSVLLVTSRRANESRKSYLFTNPEYVFALSSLNDLPKLYAEIDAAPGKGLYAAGYFGYECGYANEPSLISIPPDKSASTPLAWFGFYRDPVIFNYVPEPLSTTQTIHTELDIAVEEYFRRFNEIKTHIKAGNTYQVNLTTRLRWHNEDDPAKIFAHIMAVQPVEFGAYINLGSVQILSASPELFFRRDGPRIITRPMKGTAPRGLDMEEQHANTKWLSNDEKNRSENVMIVDLLRNDLRRICKVNTINVDKLCDVEVFPTVLQMVSTITGQLRSGINYADIFRALFPCGSITGAPKVRTMKIIRELEDQPRGVYTGTIGFISPFEEAVFNVAIRTLVLKDGRGEMGIGGGIVWDSDATEEWNECQLKGSFLSRSAPNFDLIETILWDGTYSFLQEHISRLLASAEYFGFPCRTFEIEQRLREIAKTFHTEQPQRVRLLLSQDGSIKLSSVAILKRPESGNGNKLITVCLSGQRTQSNDLFLRHKTTYRQLYDREHQQALAAGYDDAIFLNNEGNVTEGAIHNIFVIRRGQWFTPPVSDGLLPGVLRSSLMSQGTCNERQLKLEDLISADAIYLGNSVRGLRKVRQIDRLEGKHVVPLWIYKAAG